MRSNVTNRRKFVALSTRSAVGMAVAGRLSGRILGANDRIRLGVVGCGSRGNYLISRVLEQAQASNLEIAFLCDVWALNLDRTAEIVGRQQRRPVSLRRYREALKLNDVDAVIIATPDFAHTPILIDALEAGKDAYVEKPMATSLEDARAALDLVAGKSSIVQVGTQRRSESRYQAAARLLQSGILGQVSEVEAAWHDCRPRWARDFSEVREDDVDWEQYLMGLPARPFNPERFRRWHLFKDYTVGTPGLLGSHLIDVAAWFMNDPLPVSAVAHGGVYVWKDGREHADTLDCIIEYPRGCIVNYSTRLGNRYPVPSREDRPNPTVFYGTRGTFDTESWTVRPDGAGEGAIRESTTIPDPGEREENHVANWLDCLRSRKSPNAPIETGYAHSVASIMCFLAWESGSRQVYDPVSRTIRKG